MSKILKDRLAPKERVNETQKEWTYNAPSYDNRTSCSISAGDNYGIGRTNPIGKESAAPMSAGPIPQESYAFSPNKVMYGEDKKG